MHLRTRLILAAFAASALFAIAVSGASARSFRSIERNFELIWNEILGAPRTKMRFAAGGGPTVACRVTLLGRFVENTVKKETTIRQGTTNHGELESCTNGTATIRTETMPWEGRYRSFTGTLPRIRSITTGLIRATFKIRETGGLACELATEVTHPGVIISGNSAEAPETGLETTGEPENLTVERGNTVPLRGEGFLCDFAGEGTFSGIGLIRNLPRTAKIRVTLI
ncbi:MAG TPA: hypothetical protein VN635_12770 [Conexibacter sp.]|nr:hypothetical protein [Conexibacter sp.]